MAGVVASRDLYFVNYFADVRAQSPFTSPGANKERRRQSEERIVELGLMVAGLLRRWRSENKCLPDVVLYYRDGVSYGQFKPVLTEERRGLAAAFAEVGGQDYSPKLVIIVGQKRHHTRFFLDSLCRSPQDAGSNESGGKGKGKGGQSVGKGGDSSGKGGKGGGKGKGKSENVAAGTVAAEGIAAPGHMNFFLVAHNGLLGTSVPCHYHVLHLDTGLNIGADDIERVTYELCHLYSRADKTVSYASPAYFADHLCERGKLYLDTIYRGKDYSELSLSGNSGSISEEEERRLREQIDERVSDFNTNGRGSLMSSDTKLQGLHFFC